MRTAVVLPAPLGPEQSEHASRWGRAGRRQLEGLGGAESLAEALGLDRVVHGNSFRWVETMSSVLTRRGHGAGQRADTVLSPADRRCHGVSESTESGASPATADRAGLSPYQCSGRPVGAGRRERPWTEHVLDDLEWRGLIAHSTDLDALRAEMSAGPISVYCGFDPTAPSLHMGNLLQILTLRRLQDAGHRPFGLVGGATGMIGDPEGVGGARLNSLDVVKEWTPDFRAQLERFLSFEGDNAAIGRQQLRLDGEPVDDRLPARHRQALPGQPDARLATSSARASRPGSPTPSSATCCCSRWTTSTCSATTACACRPAVSDQWGNITAGVELVRRVEGEKVHALATPLVTKADGTKFGKTESGSIWLDAADDVAVRLLPVLVQHRRPRRGPAYLKYYSFRSRDEIEELAKAVEEKPFLRAAQRALADDVTTLTHGAGRDRARQGRRRRTVRRR